MNRTTVRPRSYRRQSDELGCTVSKVVGYRGECGCGWKGKVWRTMNGARLETTFHLCERPAA